MASSREEERDTQVWWAHHFSFLSFSNSHFALWCVELFAVTFNASTSIWQSPSFENLINVYSQKKKWSELRGKVLLFCKSKPVPLTLRFESLFLSSACKPYLHLSQQLNTRVETCLHHFTVVWLNVHTCACLWGCVCPPPDKGHCTTRRYIITFMLSLNLPPLARCLLLLPPQSVPNFLLSFFISTPVLPVFIRKRIYNNFNTQNNTRPVETVLKSVSPHNSSPLCTWGICSRL